MRRLVQKYWQHALLWGALIIIAANAAACVSSKSKGGGRAEAEVALPPKSVRPKPELRRPALRSSPAVDSLTEHTLDWTVLKSQIDAVRSRLDQRFLVEGFGPFIIASNLTRPQLDEIEEQTIRVSYNAFYKDYFRERPRQIMTIYLFKNKHDYIYYSRKLFRETPTTPYGYHRSAERVILINIATGTGTIVHELAHALLDADFPAVPIWFNEGFAALFEQNRIDAGSISGISNWRYPILKRAIDTNSVVRLSHLISTTDDEFYNDKEGYNYAEARYFCYYLQEKGLLQAFYSRFKETYTYDPSGLKTLEEILKKDIDSIEKEWLQWARALPSNLRRVSG